LSAGVVLKKTSFPFIALIYMIFSAKKEWRGNKQVTETSPNSAGRIGIQKLTGKNFNYRREMIL
jgi:hypothetical protein